MAIELEFRPDFEEVRGRWARFWRGESERPLLHAVRPKEGVTPVSRPRPYDCAFGDVGPKVEQALQWAETHEFLGDSIPHVMVTFAPDHFAALLGAEIYTNETSRTNWVDPCIDDLENCEIRFQRAGRWWRRTVEVIERFRERCDGKLIVTGTHLQGGLDCLTALMGTQEVLLALAEEPEAVHRALRQINVALKEVRQAMAEVLDVSTWGCMNRFFMYSEGMIDVPQCDLSCMISRDMFNKFQLPYLREEIDTTSASIYHLDGPDALHHTGSLCSIEALDMIQWMPGEGYYDDDWSELNQKIDALGKGQIFQGYYKLAPADVRRLWETLSSRKIFFHATPEIVEEWLGA